MRYLGWRHVKEARFDEVTATEPSCDCCRVTVGIFHSSLRSPSPSFPRRQNNPIAFWNKNLKKNEKKPLCLRQKIIFPLRVQSRTVEERREDTELGHST